MRVTATTNITDALCPGGDPDGLPDGMAPQLVIENGPTVEVTGRPAQGTRHEMRFGVLRETGEPVVVKVQRIAGALERERVALGGLGARDGPVPVLLAAGTAILGGERVSCLVIERRRGSAPVSIEGWQRMGRAHGRLTQLRQRPPGLPVLDRVAFGHTHAQRVRDLGRRLDSLAGSIPDWRRLTDADVPGASPLTVTHGDPGPGNFLDDGEQGTLIDWEEAHIAPRGLDLARLQFIALLGAGPEGYVGQDRQARARAALHGYRVVSPDHGEPTRMQRRWWITVAGIQFVHRRWQLGGRPAPWQAAADTLHAALTDTDLAS